jgi:hypothetical protein
MAEIHLAAANRLFKQTEPDLTIDVSNLQEQYIRFTSAHNFLMESVKAYESQNLDFFLRFHRSVKYTKPIFFSGFLTLSHDLIGQKINISHEAIGMTCIFTTDGHLHVLLSCPHKISKELYRGLLRQLELVDETSSLLRLRLSCWQKLSHLVTMIYRKSSLLGNLRLSP